MDEVSRDIMASKPETKIKEETVDAEETHIYIKEEPVSPPPCKIPCDEALENETATVYLQATNFVVKEEQADIEETPLNDIKREMMQLSPIFLLHEEPVKYEIPDDVLQVRKSQATFVVKEELIDAEETPYSEMKEETVPVCSRVKEEPIDAEEAQINEIKIEALPVSSSALDSPTQSAFAKNGKTVRSGGSKWHSVHVNYEEINSENMEFSGGESEHENCVKPTASSSSSVDKEVRGEDAEDKKGQKEAWREMNSSDGKSLLRAQDKGKRNKTEEHNSLSTHKGRQKRTKKPFLCAACGKCFRASLQLEIHERTHTGERPFECALCNKTFAAKGNLVVHMRVHSEERPFKCSTCEKSFQTSSSLHTHMRVHSGEKPFKCRVCGKAFKQSGHITMHMRCHTHEKPYECTVCGKAFVQGCSLTAHMRTHTGEKPYKCTECGVAFSRYSSLNIHTRAHTGETPYICTECGKGFSASRDLEKHRSVHTRERPFLCEVCGTRFTVSSSLSRHMGNTHGFASPVT